MDIKSSELIEKIRKHGRKPAMISGYPREDGTYIEIYPGLDPSLYYRFKKDCVIDVLPTSDDSHGYVTLLVDPTCEVERVSRKQSSAAELDYDRPEYPCHCNPLDDYDIAFLKKDEARQRVIQIARLLASWGVDELNCERVGASSVSVACCRSWNRLLGALGSESEFDAANQVLATCYGIG